jgi:hypothetical protein
VANKKHPFDFVAEKLEAIAAGPAAAQEASPDYWELHYPVDNYPQAALPKPNVVFKWGEGEGLGPDGFPTIPIPELRLKGKGGSTDVLTAGFPASWSVGHICNEKALAVFKQFDLGNFREYPVAVRDAKGVARTLTYLLIRNAVPATSVDFTQSEFYLCDMVSVPQGSVAVTSVEDWTKKRKLASEGQLDGCEQFSRIDYKKLVLHRERLPTVDLFKLGPGLGIRVYISARLKDAIEASGITGLEIKPNKRLFAGR